tara:strand:+ start:2846 stop:4012 length:1167 start_codon:yes stop_codon:yes gene_type:complete
MPGNELIGKEEQKEINSIFKKSNGVLFAHGFDKRRKNIFRVRNFEKNLKRYFRSKYVLCVTSGTAAIKIALKACGIKPGDEVITQAFNFIATIEAILDIGAIPIITNIDETLNMCPDDLLKKITKKTKAVIPVHMLGFSSNITRIEKICRQKKIKLVEDNCESIGGKYKKRFLGNFGDVGIMSFDFGKNITTGEGGCILTKNKKIYKYCKQYHDHGHELNPKFPRGMDTVSRPGFNYRMTELQGAVGIAQLKKLNLILNENKKRYNLLLKILGKKFKIRNKIKGSTPSMDTFMFEVPNNKRRSKIVNYLRKSGIGIKNVPDAIKWHFASYWEHAISRKQINSIKKSKNIIEKYIAIPISIKVSNQTYIKIAQKILSLSSEKRGTKVNK